MAAAMRERERERESCDSGRIQEQERKESGTVFGWAERENGEKRRGIFGNLNKVEKQTRQRYK